MQKILQILIVIDMLTIFKVARMCKSLGVSAKTCKNILFEYFWIRSYIVVYGIPGFIVYNTFI
jgi:hypothetical protein